MEPSLPPRPASVSGIREKFGGKKPKPKPKKDNSYDAILARNNIEMERLQTLRNAPRGPLAGPSSSNSGQQTGVANPSGVPRPPSGPQAAAQLAYDSRNTSELKRPEGISIEQWEQMSDAERIQGIQKLDRVAKGLQKDARDRAAREEAEKRGERKGPSASASSSGPVEQSKAQFNPVFDSTQPDIDVTAALAAVPARSTISRSLFDANTHLTMLAASTDRKLYSWSELSAEAEAVMAPQLAAAAASDPDGRELGALNASLQNMQLWDHPETWCTRFLPQLMRAQDPQGVWQDRSVAQSQIAAPGSFQKIEFLTSQPVGSYQLPVISVEGKYNIVLGMPSESTVQGYDTDEHMKHFYPKRLIDLQRTGRNFIFRISRFNDKEAYVDRDKGLTEIFNTLQASVDNTGPEVFGACMFNGACTRTRFGSTSRMFGIIFIMENAGVTLNRWHDRLWPIARASTHPPESIDGFAEAAELRARVSAVAKLSVLLCLRLGKYKVVNFDIKPGNLLVNDATRSVVAIDFDPKLCKDCFASQDPAFRSETSFALANLLMLTCHVRAYHETWFSNHFVGAIRGELVTLANLAMLEYRAVREPGSGWLVRAAFPSEHNEYEEHPGKTPQDLTLCMSNMFNHYFYNTTSFMTLSRMANRVLEKVKVMYLAKELTKETQSLEIMGAIRHAVFTANGDRPLTGPQEIKAREIFELAKDIFLANVQFRPYILNQFNDLLARLSNRPTRAHSPGPMWLPRVGFSAVPPLYKQMLRFVVMHDLRGDTAPHTTLIEAVLPPSLLNIGSEQQAPDPYSP
ncbi:MAG: hypothetical protein ACKVI4_13495 [Actinomycetales bacterium]